MNRNGEPVEVGGGHLALTGDWPARTLGIWGDPERYRQQYWSKWDEATYFPSDGAKRSEDGYLTLLGQVDDGRRRYSARSIASLIRSPSKR